MITESKAISEILRSILLESWEESLIEPDNNGNIKPEQLFPFHVHEILGIHTHKIGVGDGVFFRLKDGRVFDRYGEEQEPDQTLYDTVSN